AEDFYREKAGEVDNDTQKDILLRIADEEHRHWVTMQNVIQFLDRPKHWLEDAEWGHLDDM
ncbi:MAG: rubrerythrin, partial [Candidatus Zixiibacteriota bacterium]